MQHSDLLSACAEVANERDKAVSETKLLREELNKSVNVVEWIRIT